MNRVSLLRELARISHSAKDKFDRNGRNHDDTNGRFASAGGSTKAPEICRSTSKQADGWRRPKIGYKEMAMIRHELNTNLTKEERKMPIVVRCIRNAMYTVRNYGFDNYEVLDKIDLD